MAGMEQIAGMGLQQSLSPQMRQSLGILQASLAELRQLVDVELRENPVLEETAPEVSETAPEKETGGLEDEWNEYYIQRAVAEPWSREALEKRQNFFDSQTRDITLREHLLEQLLTAHWTRDEARIGVEIIGNLDESGYLRAEEADVAFAVGTRVPEVGRVLAKIQEFDPPGVAARNLGECLFLQLKHAGAGDSTAARIVQHHLQELGRKKFPEIAKALRVPLGEVRAATGAIARLNPRPGRAFSSDPDQIVLPEVIVTREGGEYTASLSGDGVPQLRIADTYKDMLPGSSREVREYLREKIRSGKFFIRSIRQRQQTILNIAREIVARQRDFLDNGPSQLRPLTMKQVADVVGVHETTVSRAISGKYMATPQGFFEMKYFFTHGYTKNDGRAVSNESVRQAIVTLLRDENSGRPLSDHNIARLLTKQGLDVARRTVAKYREQLDIPPSHLRKSF